MKPFYLETNALIQISKHLDSDWFRENTFTSILSVIELLTDLKEEVFGSKKAAICRIIESNIEIDWRQPQRILYDAFGLQTTNAISKSSLMEIMEEMIQAETRDAFLLKMASQETYQHIKACDAGYYPYFSKEILDKQQEFNEKYSYKEGEEQYSFLLGIINPNSEDYSEDGRKKFILEAASQVAEDISNMSHSGNHEDSTLQISQAYNGVIDAFLLVLGLYSYKKMALKELSANNDFTDLHHLCYLDGDTVIVSNDKGLKKSIDICYNEKCIEAAIFMEKMQTHKVD